jgi:hypothetical protein
VLGQPRRRARGAVGTGVPRPSQNALQDSDDNLIESEADFHYYRANFRSEKKRLLKLLRERLSADKIQMIQDERACKGQSMYTTVVEVSGEINLRSILMG